MSELNDLIKRYVEKKTKMSENPDVDSAEDHKELSGLEENIKSQGYDPQAIYGIVENVNPESRDDALDSIFKIIGKEETWKKPIKVSDNGFLSKSISTRETEHGLERRIDRPLIVASCGKVIKEEDIGIKCSICKKYDCKEHSFLCRYCGRALCIQHVKFFKNDEGENMPCCAEDFKKAVENQDTWKFVPRMTKKDKEQ